MNSPFIYKYQPLKLKDFEMEQELMDILNTFIEMNSLNMLFVGDSGSGKTSLISAIIREYFGDVFYNDDVLYINNLKEQGISYYRSEARTFCQTSSNIKGKKKIVVIDDLDMINEQSQQVFRGCIDKYSHNIHFIFSCTNTQKVIDSLQSRVTILKLKQQTKRNLQYICEKICRAEDIVISSEGMDFLIKISNNSIRILINYLEKLKLLGRDVDAELINMTCTNIPFTYLNEYTELCKDKRNLVKAIKSLYLLFENGYSVMDILDNYFLYIKITDIINEEEKYLIISLICKYITIFNNIHENEIEVSLFTNNLIDILGEKDK